MELMAAAHGEKPHEAIAACEKAGELPDHLYQIVRGYMPSRCILTALELDIFTAIGKGATAAQLASKIDTNSRPQLHRGYCIGCLSDQGCRAPAL
jgi:hypothetical protein